MAKTNYLGNILGDNKEAKMAIREIPLFHDCSDQLLEMVYKYGKVVDLKHGDVLIREGEFDQWVYFIISGKLEVYVGPEKVDMINSSLAGERCILGEPRKASLKAEEEGLQALGIDMAILDAFSKESPAHPAKKQEMTPYTELLSMIASEILNRIVELWFNQIEVRRKYFFYLKAEDIATIMHKLQHNLYRKNNLINLIIYRFIEALGDRILLKYWDVKRLIIDTRMISIYCNNTANETLLEALAEHIFEKLLVNHNERLYSHKNIQIFHLNTLTEQILEKLQEQNETLLHLDKKQWKNFFALQKNGRINVKSLCLWLSEHMDWDEKELVNILMVIIEDASQFTSKINGQLQEMLHELDRIKYFKKDTEATGISMDISEIISTLPAERLIPILRTHILQAHLVEPYQAKISSSKDVEKDQPEPAIAEPAEVEGSQAMIDELLKKLEQ